MREIIHIRRLKDELLMYSNTVTECNSIHKVASRESKNQILSFWLLTMLIFSTLEYLFTFIVAYSGIAPLNDDFKYLYIATKVVIPLMLLFIWLARGHIVTKIGKRFILFIAKIAAFAFVTVFMWQVFSFVCFLVL